MATTTEVIRRMGAMQVHTREAVGLLGTLVAIAPDAVMEALDALEEKRRVADQEARKVAVLRAAAEAWDLQ